MSPFVIMRDELLLLKFEGNGECEVASNGDTVVFTGLPFGHSLDYADSLVVKILVHTFDNLSLLDGTVGVDNELHDYAALNVILLSAFRITEVVLEPFHESCLTTGELSLLFNSGKDLVGFGLFFLGLFDDGFRSFRFNNFNLFMNLFELIGIVGTFLGNNAAGGVVFLLLILREHFVLNLVFLDDGDLRYLNGSKNFFFHFGNFRFIFLLFGLLFFGLLFFLFEHSCHHLFLFGLSFCGGTLCLPVVVDAEGPNEEGDDNKADEGEDDCEIMSFVGFTTELVSTEVFVFTFEYKVGPLKRG